MSQRGRMNPPSYPMIIIPLIRNNMLVRIFNILFWVAVIVWVVVRQAPGMIAYQIPIDMILIVAIALTLYNRFRRK